MAVRGKVLIVEDDRAICSFMRRVLEANGYESIIVGTGREALSMLTSHCPDVVILDLGLPDMDGMEVLKSVRKWSNLPVVVVSARNHEHDKVDALDYGADDYLVKPFGTSELLARLRTAIRHTRTTSGNASIAKENRFTARGLVIDYDKYRVYIDGRDAGLTQNEFKLVALLGRYAAADSKVSLGARIAGIFGALLIGLGVIALFAANWDVFGRGVRAALALAPVVLCGVLALVASRKGWTSMSLWEPLGIAWCIATGAAACLIAQTYQIGGTVPDLILFVALLCLPVVWVTRAVVPMAFWPIFVIAWGIAMNLTGYTAWPLAVWSLGLMALSLPAFVAFIRRKPGRIALKAGQSMTGFVYSYGTGILLLYVLAPARFNGFLETSITVFWLCAAVVLLAGVYFKLPFWITPALLVATGAAMAAAFAWIGLYVAALALAVGVIWTGVRRMKLATVNLGAALFLWLVLESRLPFTGKGIVLIGAGVALVALNVYMLRLKKRRTTT